MVAEWFAPASLSLELVKGLPAAFVALVIGSIAAWIAFQQWRVSRAKFKLDLFERRLAVFEATWGFLSSIAQKGPLDPAADETVAKFTNLLPQAEFLFGPKVRKYMIDVSERNTERHVGVVRVQAGNFSCEDVDAQGLAQSWFGDQAREGCRRIFGPYLDFSAWR